MQSFILDFRKSPSFMQKWNKEFDVEDIDTNCFYIVLVDSICDDNIADCLNSDKQLRYNEDNMISVECSLKYVVVSDEISNICLDGDTSITFPYTDAHHTAIENFDMKGIFLTNDAGYVMGYTINPTSLLISNEMVFEDDLVFWDIVEGEGNG